MQVNNYNFLRWDDGQAEADNSLPHAYWKDREHCGYMPVALFGEQMSFYINSETGFNYSNFADLRLALVKATNNVVVNANLAPLSRHFVDVPVNTFYNIYSSVLWPLVNPGMYYLKIYRFGTGEEVMRSNYILYRIDDALAKQSTAIVRFRHDRYFYHVRYAALPLFYQQFRLNVSVMDEQIETNVEIYRAVNTGKQRTYNNDIGKFYVVETYYFDPGAHDAAAIMAEHAHLEINGKVYTRKASYKQASSPNSKLNKGNFEVYDLSFASANRC